MRLFETSIINSIEDAMIVMSHDDDDDDGDEDHPEYKTVLTPEIDYMSGIAAKYIRNMHFISLVHNNITN